MKLWYPPPSCGKPPPPPGIVVPAHVLKLVMKQSKSNTIDSGNFTKKFKEI